VPADIVILDGARTPFGAYCGGLREVTATELGVVAARGALERARVAPATALPAFSMSTLTGVPCLTHSRSICLMRSAVTIFIGG